jgi:hypothetical protein
MTKKKSKPETSKPRERIEVIITSKGGIIIGISG